MNERTFMDQSLKMVNDTAFNDYTSNAVTAEIKISRVSVRKLIISVRNFVFKEVGGQPVIDSLVDEFYYIMQTDPEARDCLATHAGRDIQESARKLKFFLSGWLGGPQLYLEKYGHPRLRMRHNPFLIGAEEGRQWLYCMKKALERSSIKPELQIKLMDGFTHVANMIIQ
jgi:hemoglobin